MGLARDSLLWDYKRNVGYETIVGSGFLVIIQAERILLMADLYKSFKIDKGGWVLKFFAV